MLILTKLIHLNSEYKANIISHLLCFVINVSLYILTNHLFFLFVETSCICLIGYTNSQNGWINANINKQFIIVSVYYVLSSLLIPHHHAYFVMVFIFTYLFFVYKDNGFSQSLNSWTYGQALLIATTFTFYPLSNKLLANFCGLIMAQFSLNFCLKIYPSPNKFIADNSLKEIFHHKNLAFFFAFNQSYVKLAIRGAVTAACLYIISTDLFHDARPNWAVATAISCLFRTDEAAITRSIQGSFFGLILGSLISALYIFLFAHHQVITVLIVWLSTFWTLIYLFEYRLNPNVKHYAIGTMFFVLAIVSLFTALDMNSIDALFLRVGNVFVGILFAFLAQKSWNLMRAIV